jgi:hypothetical protein
MSAKGVMPEHHNCVDCGINTAPACSTREEVDNMLRAGALNASEKLGNLKVSERSEIYMVRNKVWAAAGMEPGGGCLCIGCLEKRLGRQLRPKDFQPRHPFNEMPGTARLMDRRGQS